MAQRCISPRNRPEHNCHSCALRPQKPHEGIAIWVFWLDVHDPTLMRVNAFASEPLRSILIALIVEIALLNSTHVIALHATHSIASRWVPYELARAKARGLTSLQAAGWFEPGQTPKTCGDYVQLAVMTNDEQQVIDWIRMEPRANPVQVPDPCTEHRTKKLI